MSTPRHAHDFLLASIQDVKSAIGANDSKASAALIVHGLIFTGLVELLVRLGGAYEAANETKQEIAIGLLCATLITFLVSIYYILRALLPYRPKNLESKMQGRYKGVFFPLPLLDRSDPHADMLGLVGELDEAGITTELVAERLKLADILRYESLNTQLGYRFLELELVFASAFLVLVATAVL
ncbi:MAG TPA: hypothetical protein VES65_02950 [Solirubrobacteraceae bacterium]|nr:hypothetical protein [Solirubrobacteraceae bacterium]